jgi:serine/threonine-protein kinase RsbW
MRRRAVADDLNDIQGATVWVGEMMAQADIAEDVRFNIEVCLEEALANLIQHARPARDAKDIAISVSTDADGAVICVTDRCVPFDSTEALSPQAPGPEDLHAGGQGLRLLRAFASELTYSVGPEGNELTMRFRSAT